MEESKSEEFDGNFKKLKVVKIYSDSQSEAVSKSSKSFVINDFSDDAKKLTERLEAYEKLRTDVPASSIVSKKRKLNRDGNMELTTT